jgi:hypothetical protein
MAGTKDSDRRYSARRFAVGALVCPACQRRMEEPAGRCPHCGFTGTDCLRLFPFAAPSLQEVVDPEGLLDKVGLAAVRGSVARLRRRFRQVHWSLCLVRLPAETNLRLFGFWLLNSARMPADNPEAPAWTVLLVMDFDNAAASVTTGYALEPFVADDAWLRALMAMSVPWRRGAYAEALCEFLHACGNELATGAWRAERLLLAQRGGGE